VSSRGEPTLFIVDNDEVAREELATLLRSAGHGVEAFANAETFIAKRGEARGGCVLLDVRLPGMTGLDLQEWLAQRNHRLPVVFITAHGDIPMAVRAVKRGAIDFLQKPVDERQLLAAVDAALARDDAPSAATGTLPAAVATLSRREREVLDLILAGRQTRVIAESLFISVKTVEFHRSRIHAKLGVSSLAALFNLCLGRGSRAIHVSRPHS
jgi:two-component system, LuxR family, response regulator FixJ